MAKLVSCFFTLILLIFMLSFTVAELGRSDQVLQNQQRVNMDTSDAEISDEINCEMLDKDECLSRRSLAAHLDYIYTQEQPIGSP
ncbi:hypothetical protein SOVF_095860 [Spinacia oleracea]|uniref:Phytosulfokine n=1 Tax=Spinacia oleracea TaxID=3562 RepID=A0ABM3QVH0_SPIOL|nr:phytosulfokines-like [Spinacia oleracea]KNA15577.1 hypothetical protein SOVF_095860 [Spinacia oleracea]